MVEIPALSLCQSFGTEWHMCRFFDDGSCSTVHTCSISIGFLSKRLVMISTASAVVVSEADAVEIMTGLEFRLLSASCAERVDDLVDRLAEESCDLLRGLSRSGELAYGLPVARG